MEVESDYKWQYVFPFSISPFSSPASVRLLVYVLWVPKSDRISLLFSLAPPCQFPSPVCVSSLPLFLPSVSPLSSLSPLFHLPLEVYPPTGPRCPGVDEPKTGYYSFFLLTIHVSSESSDENYVSFPRKKVLSSEYFLGTLYFYYTEKNWRLSKDVLRSKECRCIHEWQIAINESLLKGLNPDGSLSWDG